MGDVEADNVPLASEHSGPVAPNGSEIRVPNARIAASAQDDRERSRCRRSHYSNITCDDRACAACSRPSSALFALPQRSTNRL